MKMDPKGRNFTDFPPRYSENFILNEKSTP